MTNAFPDTAGGSDSPAVAGLDALLLAAVRACPDAILFRDATGAATVRTVAADVAAIAQHFRHCGLRRGERVLLVMGATTQAVVAMIAALRAGLEPALAPCGLGPVELAAHVRAADAVALVGPTHYGSLALGDAYLSAAALSETIRLVATLGPGHVDGAADLSVSVLEPLRSAAAADPGPTNGEPEAPGLLTFEGQAQAPVAVSQRQGALFAAALALIDAARINPSKPILSLIVPASLAGLVGGPYAALIGAASLTLHGPFEARGFLAAHDGEPGAHLLVPAAMGPILAETGLTAGEGSLILLSRFASPTAFVLPPALAGGRALVDFYAFGEAAVLGQRRDGDTPQAPAALFDGSLPGRLGVALNRARSESRLSAVGD